jgi:hypothetical protein
MFERFDEPARRALFFSRYHASQFGHHAIEPAHLAVGAIHSLDEIRLPTLLDRLRQTLGWGDTKPLPLQFEIPFSVATRSALEAAKALADRLGHRNIRAAHLLVAVMSDAASPATAILREMGVDPDRLLTGITDDASGHGTMFSGASVERVNLDADTTADERHIRAMTDQLFISTDLKDWPTARPLFADDEIDVDMTSLAGGIPLRMTADDLIAGFRVALHAGKTSHHLVANYQVTVDQSSGSAELFAHGYAWNRVLAWPAGQDLWETWGTYRLTFKRIDGHWLIAGFRYDSKLTRGNDAVRTHTEAS